MPTSPRYLIIPFQCLLIAGFTALTWAGTLVSMGAERPAESPRPNIVFILADDYGIDNVGAYGSDVFKNLTPNMDRLAAEGMLFTQAYCHPKCGPTRRAFQSGQYPFRNGVIGKVGIVHPRAVEDDREPFLARILNQAGYRTGTFGKSDPTFYDEVLDTANGQDYYRTSLFYRKDGEESTLSFDAPVYSQTVILDYALDFMERHQEGPFYCYIPINLPHVPWHPSPELLREKGFPWIHPTEDTLDLAGYQDANLGKDFKDLLDEVEDFTTQEETYLSMNARIDEIVGDVLDKLEALGIRQNTLVLLSGDNGSLTGQVRPRVWDPASERYRAVDNGKDSYGDGGGRVPFILSWPAKVLGGQKVTHLADFTDLLPTFADLAGAELPEQFTFDGHSLAPLLEGRAFTPREFIFVQRGPIYWIRNAGFRMDYDGTFYDYSDAPFSMTALDPATLTPEQQQARDRLDHLLNEKLAPKHGINYEAASDVWMKLPYWDWKIANWSGYSDVGITAISGDAADPDADEWPNLFEMAWDTAPTSPGATPPLTAAQAAGLSEGQNISPNPHVRIERVETAGEPAWGTVYKTFTDNGAPVLRATRTDMTQASGSDPVK